MKILIRKSDNFVLECADNFVFDTHLAEPICILDLTEENTYQVEVSSFPEYFISNVFKFIDNEFVLINEGKYNTYVRENTVPQTITPRQLRLVLLEANLLDEVEDMVATDRAMGIWWEYSLEILRDNEYIVNAGVALGLSEEQLDNLFIEGAKL